MAESNPLLERCRAFVEQQSCGEWDDKTINDDAAKLHDFVLLEIARADLVEPLVEALRESQRIIERDFPNGQLAIDIRAALSSWEAAQ